MNDEQFQEAFMAEFSESPPEEEKPHVPPVEEVEESNSDEPAEEPQEEVADEGVAQTSDAEQADTDEEEVDKPQEPPVEVGDKEEETPKFATKNDVLEAIREDRQLQNERQNFTADLRKKVIEQLHPEGIDKKLYDSQNRPINTAQDIVDRGLINPDTNEPFEYEEAARWMMNAQNQLNKQVEDLERYAETVAETYVDLKEGNDRVQELYGDVLAAMPGVAQTLSQQYFATLRKDPETGLIIEAPLDPVEYYHNALAPYIKLAEQIVAQEEQAKEAKQKQAVNARDERTGLPPRGSSKVKSNTGDPFLDALMDEMEE